MSGFRGSDLGGESSASLDRAARVGALVAAFALALAPVAGAAATETTRQEAAAHPVAGVVIDAAGRSVADARVEIVGADVAVREAAAVERADDGAATTDSAGRFTLLLGVGEWTIVVTHADFPTLRRTIVVDAAATELRLQLRPAGRLSETVTVVGIRPDADAPVTEHTLDRAAIESISAGQDAPALLQATPSITWYSDSGTGANYSYFSLRGIQQSRINMTYDGAPLNDPAEHVVYFNNFHDFVHEVDSIQVQRGVGTSSVGAPSYGGSVNFASAGPRNRAGGDARLVIGSYGTARASIGYGSGRLGSGFHVGGRFSYATSDGYRDRSGTEHDTLFLSAGWEGESAALKLTGFSGDEKSQLAYLAVEPSVLADDRRFNPLGPDDRDRFGQDFLQLRYTRAFGEETLVTASAYYNGAAGWFSASAEPDPLIFGVDQQFVGAMVTANRRFGSTSATVGIHANDFSGEHALDIGADRLYTNTGHKQTANAFAKVEKRAGSWLLFGDLQLRWARFDYEGNVDLGSIDWTFLDPRVGARYFVSPTLSLYGSVGRAQREPARLDLLLGEDNASVVHDLAAVRPETVVDFELGIDFDTPRLRAQANLYAMEFRDEIALTGELNGIGLPLRRNVEKSYRRGIEIDLRWLPAPGWSVVQNLNLSRNRIGAWTQFYDVYDPAGAWVDSVPIGYRNVPPVLTPELVGNLTLEWRSGLTSAAIVARRVGGSHLDNTGLDEFRLPAYTNVDLRGSLGLGSVWPAGRPRLTLLVNNLFDGDGHFPSGYSYQFLNRASDGRDSLAGIPFYYPLATRNVVLSLEVDL